MKEQSVKNYLGCLEAAKSMGDPIPSAKVIEKARRELFESESTAEIKTVFEAKNKFDGNTYFEELQCLGFYPQERRLEAVLKIKRSYGYGGNIGGIGSYQYVGFWVDWSNDGDFNDTGEDVGAGYVHVFDPGSALSNVKEKEICYAVYRDTIPLPTLKPGTIVRVRAILSWQVKPTGPSFVPVWGNRLECAIRIDPIE